jgi:uracil-DNA glycosylase
MKIIQALDSQSDWQALLTEEAAKGYLQALDAFLEAEQAAGKQVLPPAEQRLNALLKTPLGQVKVVILGQDPYPTPGHAHGLSFSVDAAVTPLPKSLQNIYRELADDLGIENTTGDLSLWAQQGVLLLNSVLTVVAGNAASHAGKGWEQFTDAIIRQLNDCERPLVFVLWGAYAQKKGKIINRDLHYVIETPHPSPLSAYRGFYGSKPFSKVNRFLEAQGQLAIDWQIK